MSEQFLLLTADEVLILADRVRNEDAGTDPHGLSAFPLLLRLGSAYLEMVGDGHRRDGVVQVAVSEAEAWLLRSKVSSADKTATDALFGVKLLSKLYRVLLAYNAVMDVPEAGGVDDEFTDDRRRALRRYLGG